MNRWMAGFLVISKLKSALGLSNARVCISACGRLSGFITAFFASLDVAVKELYGQVETSYATCANTPGATRFGTVGRPLRGVEIDLLDQVPDDEQLGEISIRGPNVFLGYHDGTGVDDGGWFHSGDIGRIDADGYLTIVGRAADIIDVADGRCLDPVALEDALTSHRLIESAVLTADGSGSLVALIVLDDDALNEFSVEHGVSLDDRVLEEVVELRVVIRELIARVNGDLSRGPVIQSFVILEQGFTRDGGELTPVLGIRRFLVQEQYGSQ